MSKIDLLLLGVFWFILGHVAVFFQLNGQFKWEWFAKNEWALALFGLIISFFYIWGTKYTVLAFDGLLWPPRFIGFGIGMIVYALGVWFMFKEGINAKTLVSLVLCFILISIQVLWKTETKDKVDQNTNIEIRQ